MIIVPPAHRRSVNLRIPVVFLLLGAAVVAGLAAGATVRTYRLERSVLQSAAAIKERDRLKAVTEGQAQELNTWRSQVQGLNVQVHQLETAQQNLQDLEARVQQLLGGSGGPDTSNPTPPATATALSPTELSQLIGTVAAEQQAHTADLKTAVADLEQYNAIQAAIPKGWPAAGSVTDPYGYRIDPFGRGRLLHEGVDIAGAYGSEISARADGVVIFAGWRDDGYGYTVVIDHGNGYQTLYAHASSLRVLAGDSVKRGDVVANMGSTGRSTGNHVHYEVHRSGQPVDPTPYLN
ncbi:MAG: M23 family metallopeptidase [Mycobacterium leprae]